jgi:hypothetical protein
MTPCSPVGVWATFYYVTDTGNKFPRKVFTVYQAVRRQSPASSSIYVKLVV